MNDPVSVRSAYNKNEYNPAKIIEVSESTPTDQKESGFEYTYTIKWLTDNDNGDGHRQNETKEHVPESYIFPRSAEIVENKDRTFSSP